MRLRKAVNIAVIAATACYPAAVWWALRNGLGGTVLWIAAGLILLRLILNGFRRNPILVFLLLAMTAAAAAFSLSGEALLAKLYPVFAGCALLAVFGYSLTTEKCIVQRFAEVSVPPEERSEFFRLYCRRVTWAWCIFYVLNGSVALSTCVMSDTVWALWNGFISYIMMGFMFAGEFAIRIYLKRKKRF